MSGEHTQGWRSTSDEAWGRDPICMGCRMPWPCEVATLTAELAAERAEVERLRVALVTTWQGTADGLYDLLCGQVEGGPS